MKKKEEIALTLCMIVKNEAHNLEECIKPLKSVLDEIIVVDTGSEDETKKIAKNLGAKVFDFTWCNDFAAARNESIRHAMGDYILWLDADDRIDEQNIEKIKLLRKDFSARRDKAYYLIINNQSPVDGETLFRQLRIFPNIRGALFQGKVHEQICYSLIRKGIKFENIDIEIKHIGYSDSESIIKKAQRNLSIIERELRMTPNDFILHYNAARTLAMMGRQKEAIAHMKIITENRNLRNRERQFFLESALLMGKYHIELGLYEKAISLFYELSEEFKENALIHFCLGQAHFLSKNYTKAIEEFKKSLLYPLAISLFPVNLNKLKFDLHYNLAKCYLKNGQEELAKEHFLKSLEFKNNGYKSYRDLGLLSLIEGNFNEAIKYYENLISHGEASDQDYTNLGLAYKKVGFYNKAEQAFCQALEINPHRIEALINLGYLYHENKNYLKAKDFFKRSLALDPDLKDVKLMLSDIYFRFYDIDGLMNQCDCLLKELQLDNDIVVNNFEELSILYEKIGDTFLQVNQRGLSFLAYRTALLISPDIRILEKILKDAKALGLRRKETENLKEVIEFHKLKEIKNDSILHSLEET